MKTNRLILASIVPLVGLAIWSFTWGIADLLSIKPLQSMYVWEYVGKIDRPAAWEQGVHSLEKARKLDRTGANYDYYLGKFHEWKALEYPIWSADSRRHRDEAIALYRIACSKRPTWSLAWTSLTQSKFLNQQMDGEAFDAMRKAITLGQHEPIIQYKLIWISMTVWEHFSDELREIMKDTIRKSLQHPEQAKNIIKMMVQLNRESIIFPMITDPGLLIILEDELEGRNQRQNKISRFELNSERSKAYGGTV